MELDEHPAFLASLTRHMAEGVFAIDRDGHVLFMNAEAERLFGMTAADVVGKLAQDTILRTPVCSFAAWADRLCMQQVCRREDETFVRADGSTFPVAFVAAPIREGEGILGSVTVFRDITYFKAHEEDQHALIEKLSQTQAQLLQSEKMASIGQLAAGVAHEINNPVGYISSNLSTLQGYLADLDEVLDGYDAIREALPPATAARTKLEQLLQHKELAFVRRDMRDLVSESLEGVARVQQIVQDLKDFSHVDSQEWTWSDLHRGLDSTLNIVHNELKYKAEVVKEYGQLPLVESLASQLNQVFMNLLVNAAHAIAEHGRIYVRTGCEGGQQIWVEIADTGCGISQENMKRIFDPFFTTKAVGKGTGLGLSLAYSIIQKHHGRIEVSSEVGKGSAFRIWLPVSQPEPMADKPHNYE